MFGNLKLVLHCNISLRRYTPFARTLSYISTNPRVHARPEGKVSPLRGAVPEYVTARIRQDVLLTPMYRNRVVGVRKSWIDASDSTSDILSKIKLTGGSDVALLASLSHEEFIQLMSEVVNVPFMKIPPGTINALEEECCCRVGKLDAASLLFIADVFYVLKTCGSPSRFSFSSAPAGISSRYVTAMLKAFDYRWPELVTSHHDVVLLSFHVSVARKSLLHLMHRIEEHVEEHAERFSASELSLICHAFFTNNTAFRRYTLLEKISKVVERDFALGEFKLNQLGCILKALRHAQYAGAGFYERLGSLLSSVAVEAGTGRERVETTAVRAGEERKLRKDVTLNDLNNIAFVYASLKLVHPGLFDWISRMFAASVPRDGRGIRMKDVARLLWSYTTLATPVPESLSSHLLQALRRDPALLYAHPDQSVEALVALAMSGIYPTDILDRVFSQRFLDVKSLRQNEQNFQLMILNSAACIECPRYKGSYPSPEFMRSVSSEYFGNVERELATRQGLRAFVESMKHLFGKERNLIARVHFILPHSRLADVEIRVDAISNTPLTYNENSADGNSLFNEVKLDQLSTVNSNEQRRFSSIENNVEHTKRRNSTGSLRTKTKNISFSKTGVSKSIAPMERKITIKVTGHNQYAANDPTVLLGLHEMEIRLLETLGYEVYIVDPTSAQFLDHASEGQKLEYVKQFLTDTCHISLL